jgi:hypothetical protein
MTSNDAPPTRSSEQQASHGAALTGSAVYQSYLRSPYLSVKHSSYFQVYDDLLASRRGTDFTFVEIGVLNGGSLFMWRDYFGPRARIIGVDLNPAAKRWEAEGFEIHIGNQAQAAFWDELIAKVGPMDVVLDDGGHTNDQQIVTADKLIGNIRDGGMLIVEDTHTSYFRDFGNPSKHSFIAWAKLVADSINSRFPGVSASRLPHRHTVYNVGFYESIVAFHVDRTRCFESTPTTNQGTSLQAQDFRHQGSRSHGALDRLSRSVLDNQTLRRLPGARTAYRASMAALGWLRAKSRSPELRKYFY